MKLIKFTQTTCQPCKILNQMLGMMGGSVDEERLLDTPELLAEAEKEHNVMSTPTLLLLDDEGNEVARTVGVHPPSINNILVLAKKM
jgi:hypothetical protein